MTKSFLSFDKALEMYRRDTSSGFGRDYIPAIQVTRPEAPGCSSPALLRSEKLERDLHLLSKGEVAAALHALFLPELRDLHEEKILQPGPALHPLAKHPEMEGKILANVPGTDRICESLGCKHPFAFMQDSEGNKHRIHFPYVGDLLLILACDKGLFCVNWTIKRSSDQFGLGDQVINPADSELFNIKKKALRRLEIEKLYYAPAEIKTFAIAFDNFNHIVTHNLFRIMCFAQRSVTIDDQLWAEIVFRLNNSLEKSRSINQMATDIALYRNIPVHQARNLIYRAIWEHQLKVNLYTTILPDRPLQPEKTSLVDQIRQKWIYGSQSCN